MGNTSSDKMKAENIDNIIVYSHRGNCSLKSENTLNSFKQCINENITNIELDVQITLDRKVVVSHDVLKHNTSIYQLNCDSEYSTNQLLLKKVFLMLPKQTNYIIDLKDVRSQSQLVPEVLKICAEYNNFDKVIFSSFNEFHLQELVEYEKTNRIDLKKSYTTCNLDIDYNAEKITRYNLNYILLNINQVSLEMINKIKRNSSIKVFVYTCNSNEDYNYSLNIGADGIISDNPEKFI